MLSTYCLRRVKPGFPLSLYCACLKSQPFRGGRVRSLKVSLHNLMRFCLKRKYFFFSFVFLIFPGIQKECTGRKHTCSVAGISTFSMVRQENLEFKASLGYMKYAVIKIKTKTVCTI